MLETKEFYEIMDVFEKTSKKFLTTGGQGFNKEPKERWSKQVYYADGKANEAFKLYLVGYSHAKSVYTK